MKNFISSFLSKVKKKRPRDYILYSAVIAVGLFLDQLTKWLAEKYLAPLYPKSVVIINKVVSLTYAENTGAAFGSMKDARWIFMVTSTILIVVLSAYLYLGFAENKLSNYHMLKSTLDISLSDVELLASSAELKLLLSKEPLTIISS